MADVITLEFLEDIVAEMEKAGEEWADAHQIARRMEEGKKTLLAKLKNEIADKLDSGGFKVTDGKLERLARADDKYSEYIEAWTAAEGEALKRKTKYETIKNHFEARRSWVSLEKAKTSMI